MYEAAGEAMAVPEASAKRPAGMSFSQLFFSSKEIRAFLARLCSPRGTRGTRGTLGTLPLKGGGITFFGLARRRILGLHAHAKAATEAMLPSESQSSLGSPRTVHCPYLSRMC